MSLNASAGFLGSLLWQQPTHFHCMARGSEGSGKEHGPVSWRVGVSRVNCPMSVFSSPIGTQKVGRGGGASPWLNGKESSYNAGAAGDTGSIPGSGRSPGGGYGNPLQDSCFENPHGQRSPAGYSRT